MPSVPQERPRESARAEIERFSSTASYRPLRKPQTVEDHDACALYASVQKDAKPTHEAIETALVALEKMLHRAGNVDGEGDGCGVLIDIPRKIWAEEVRAGGHASQLALDHCSRSSTCSSRARAARPLSCRSARESS